MNLNQPICSYLSSFCFALFSLLNCLKVFLLLFVVGAEGLLCSFLFCLNPLATSELQTGTGSAWVGSYCAIFFLAKDSTATVLLLFLEAMSASSVSVTIILDFQSACDWKYLRLPESAPAT